MDSQVNYVDLSSLKPWKSYQSLWYFYSEGHIHFGKSLLPHNLIFFIMGYARRGEDQIFLPSISQSYFPCDDILRNVLLLLQRFIFSSFGSRKAANFEQKKKRERETFTVCWSPSWQETAEEKQTHTNTRAHTETHTLGP